MCEIVHINIESFEEVDANGEEDKDGKGGAKVVSQRVVPLEVCQAKHEVEVNGDHELIEKVNLIF